MVKVNLLAIGAVFLILLLMKRQLLLPVILVLSIETAIWINPVSYTHLVRHQRQGIPLPQGVTFSPAFCETAKSRGFFW